jgi:protein SCO1/2
MNILASFSIDLIVNSRKVFSMHKKVKLISVIITAVCLAGIVFLSIRLFKTELPVLGDREHQLESFQFLNQDSVVITEKDREGKVAVIEFFFSTCPGICPIMNKNLQPVYETFKDRKDFIILSHTVNPAYDSVAVLKAYSKKIGAYTPVWQLLTGDKKAIYDAARYDYMMNVVDPATDIEDDFIHTEQVALIDQQGKIRGYFDATDEESMKLLIRSIKSLL